MVPDGGVESVLASFAGVLFLAEDVLPDELDEFDFL